MVCTNYTYSPKIEYNPNDSFCIEITTKEDKVKEELENLRKFLIKRNLNFKPIKSVGLGYYAHSPDDGIEIMIDDTYTKFKENNLATIIVKPDRMPREKYGFFNEFTNLERKLIDSLLREFYHINSPPKYIHF